jgi:hypothetical protein
MWQDKTGWQSSEKMAAPNSASLLLRIRRLMLRYSTAHVLALKPSRLSQAATSGGMYESIAFTHETTDGRKTYLEWQGKVFGQHVGGTTILTRNHEGLIEHIQLYHSPLPVVVEFSRELAKRLQEKVDQALFPEE